MSPPPDRDPDVALDDFDVEHWQFDDVVWPAMYNRVEQFGALKVSANNNV